MIGDKAQPVGKLTIPGLPSRAEPGIQDGFCAYLPDFRSPPEPLVLAELPPKIEAGVLDANASVIVQSQLRQAQLAATLCKPTYQTEALAKHIERKHPLLALFDRLWSR